MSTHEMNERETRRTINGLINWLRLHIKQLGQIDENDSLARLMAVSYIAEDAEAALQTAVYAARQDGATWQEIATATGIRSRQAAQQRWGKAAALAGITPKTPAQRAASACPGQP